MARKVKLVSWGRTIYGTEYAGKTTSGEELMVIRHPRAPGWLCRLRDLRCEFGAPGAEVKDLFTAPTLSELRDKLDAGLADERVRDARISASKPISLSDMLVVAENAKAETATLFVAGMCFRPSRAKLELQLEMCEEKPVFEVVFDTENSLFVNVYTGDPK